MSKLESMTGQDQLPNYGSESETTAAKQSDLSGLEVREDLDDCEVVVSSSSED